MNKTPFIRISPDYDVLYQDGDGCCDSAYGDIIYNDAPCLGPRFSIVAPGIEEWLKRYEFATDFAEAMTDPSFDCITWHYEGLCFAKAIWEQMPRCFKLYYQPPYEDHSGTLGEVVIDENVESLIDSLRMFANKIESFIHGLDIQDDGIRSYVNESFVLFPDWGGCIFWDTMGVGNGDFAELFTDFGDIKLNVPGLEKWGDFYDNHDDSQTFEEWWLEGWELAKEIRRQLPDRIDLFYMCFDPKDPNKIIDYESGLPRIIVPKQ